MKPLTPPSCSQKHHQSGISLVELMVAVAIGLLVVAGATTLYLNAGQTQRTLTERQNMFESARIAMDIIGRDLENAGFYPSESSPVMGVMAAVQRYQNPCINPWNTDVPFCDFANPPAFDQAVMGCSGKRLVRSGSGAGVSYACGDLSSGVTSTDADSLVVNYYTNDANGLSNGQRADCEGSDVVRDAINSRNKTAPTASPLANPNRLTYSDGLPNDISSSGTTRPALPLFVSNRYTLVSGTEQINGKTISTRSLACDGNGNDNDSNSALASSAAPLVSNLIQLKFRFLQITDTAGQGQYVEASNGTNWSNVVGVRVCILANGYSSSQLPSYTIQDCNNESKTYTDGIARKVFTQTFALKNVLM
jgi:type IV pilus assembly protein PilW